jgi:uracil-DNA glycosylase
MSWEKLIQQESEKPYFKALQTYLKKERKGSVIYPDEENVFRALEVTKLEDVRVVILGQDPYHGEFLDGVGHRRPQAMGLSFSVPEGCRLPPSLRNIFKELSADLNIEKPESGDLTGWARQGVLLLNTVLTVRAGQPNSHKNKGWEYFTDEIIRGVSSKEKHVVFVLWGNHAKTKKLLIDLTKHTVLESSHPSPLSAHNGFLGSKVFSKINQALVKNNQVPVEWVESVGPQLNAQTKSDLQELSINAKLGIDLSPEFDNIDSSIDWLEKQL